ncbi:MAG: cupin domain-containing protein [Devosia sp.]
MTGNLSKTSLEFFTDDGRFPNSRQPVLIYGRAVAPEHASPEAMEALFDGNGWPSQWRSGVYDFHHYHSTAHECLGVARGSAELRLGGPIGRVFAVTAGDVVVLPAGTTHQRVSASDDFLVVGAYPPGANWDLLRGEPGERPAADQRIAAVPLPKSDPVGGAVGPVLEKWA